MVVPSVLIGLKNLHFDKPVVHRKASFVGYSYCMMLCEIVAWPLDILQWLSCQQMRSCRGAGFCEFQLADSWRIVDVLSFGTWRERSWVLTRIGPTELASLSTVVKWERKAREVLVVLYPSCQTFYIPQEEILQHECSLHHRMTHCMDCPPVHD